jgi:hypothetical protein
MNALVRLLKSLVRDPIARRAMHETLADWVYASSRSPSRARRLELVIMTTAARFASP